MAIYGNGWFIQDNEQRQGLDLIMRGEPITAVEAEKSGLINKALSQKDISSFVDAIVHELSLLPQKQ